MSKLYVGIDPDSKGAVAVLNLADSAMDVVHLPNEILTVKTTGTKRSYLEAESLASMCLSIVAQGPSLITIEEQQAFQDDGAHGAFTHGTNYGRLQGSFATAILALDKRDCVTVQATRPVEWKGYFGLIFPELTYAKKKKKCVEFASALFPHHAHLWAKVKDTSLAEAALIALFTALSDGAKLPSIKGVGRPTTLIHHKVMLPDLQ